MSVFSWWNPPAQFWNTFWNDFELLHDSLIILGVFDHELPWAKEASSVLY